MKRIGLVLFLQIFLLTAFSQGINSYQKKEVMIPMRDGVKLYTVILTPKDATGTFPVLMQRTPYGAEVSDNFDILSVPNYSGMAKEGYIFVFQDIRGKHKSEGSMEIHQPVTHLKEKGTIDESTDTWDAVDWLIKNVPNNNGRAGIFGISYPGWLALTGAIDPHPALKAASEQACMGDLFLGDDFHHNGAFRLDYSMGYTYLLEHVKTSDSDFPYPQYDLYDWFLKLGSLKNVNAKYFHGKIPTWNSFVDHPNYDAYWQKNSPLNYVTHPYIPMLHVGGYYDQEDINGPQLMYDHMEKKDTFNRNFIILGPWNHGGWARGKGDSLGLISFDKNTSDDFKVLQKSYFDFYLKDIGSGKFDEANCFQTGSNVWKSYSAWPPKEVSNKKLFVGANHSLGFQQSGQKGYASYTSDPASPVPYRTLPIEATYGRGSRWKPWQVEDQRFVYTRPDVLSFKTEPLENDLTVSGKIMAHLIASTSGTDADWVVKLIDVYPDFDRKNLSMSGFQFPVAMEVFRGRFRKNFTNPSPLVPNKPEEFKIDLHDINHVFLKGHRLMVQIQSTWFPLIDRNPQKYVPNIFNANDDDFIKAEQRIYYRTYIDLPVMEK
ncbi:MAG: CocE/NonD family hydrolase [Ginsengibacter sp.]